MFPKLSQEQIDLAPKFEKVRDTVREEGLPGNLSYTDFISLCVLFDDSRTVPLRRFGLNPRHISLYATVVPWVVKAGGITELQAGSYLEKLAEAEVLRKPFGTSGNLYLFPDKELLRSNMYYLMC